VMVARECDAHIAASGIASFAGPLPALRTGRPGSIDVTGARVYG
jgi:hypothetical protein